MFAMRNTCVSLNDTFDQKIKKNREARILIERIKSLTRSSCFTSVQVHLLADIVEGNRISEKS